MNSRRIFWLTGIACLTLWCSLVNAELRQPANTWVKRSPLPDTPVSPRLGYEGACVWDNAHRVLIRYGGHLDPSGKPYAFGVYAYRIRAANASGTEGGPSPYILTIPSAPQWVFAREDDGTCRIKWAKNREQNLKGYRVYRLDGRWEKDSITRMANEPVAGLRYSDSTAGTAIRRYHVVAVDVLGQEGLPSAPVWYNREWKRFYEPFTGAWHQ